MQCKGQGHGFLLIFLLSALFVVIESADSSPGTTDNLCPIKTDLLFLVDKSGSIKEWQFKKMKEFLVQFVEKLDVSANHTRVAMSLFAKKFHKKWCFDDYMEKSELIEAMAALSCRKCKRGLTVTGEGMEGARNEMLLPSCGMRNDSDVVKVVVILTDGKSTETEERGYPEDWIEKQAQQLRQQVDTIFAIGVGEFDNTELVTITGDAAKVFEITNFNDLIDVLDAVTNGICPGAVCEEEIDLVFLLDKSGSIIKKDQWELEKHFVSEMIDRFQITEKRTHVALSIFDQFAKHRWCFNDYPTAPELKEAVKNLRCKRCRMGKTGIGQILRHTREFLLHPGCRMRDSHYQKVVVLVTDGKSTEAKPFWKAQAEALKNNPDTTVVTVGVGEYRLSQLEKIASEERLVFTADSFEELMSKVKDIASAACVPRNPARF